MDNNFDFGIIGSGPAGFTSALLAVEKGYSVVLFEKENIGGVCLNKGCIPTKTIMHSAELYREVKNSESIGILANDIKFDFSKILERKTKVVDLLRNALTKALESKGVVIVRAYADVISENTIKADEKEYNCKKIIVATGSMPKVLPNLEFDGSFILNSDDLFNLKELPKDILIVGAGAEGIEWARIFRDLDCNVTVIEAQDRPLSIADNDVSKYIERLLKIRKIGLKLSTRIESIKDKTVTLSNGEMLNPDAVLVAIGRTPIKPEINGKVIYLGDVCDKLMLANFAMYQARALISGIHFDNVFIPSVIYGTPEIAWVGACEQDLPVGSYKKSMYPIKALGKAHCDNEIDGFIKILSYDDKIIGAHIISKEASAMIHQLTIAMQNEISTEELKKVCFAHPTYSEGIYESILGL